MKSPHVRATFGIDDWDSDLGEHDMRANLKVMLQEDDLPAILLRIAQFLKERNDGTGVEYLELDLRGHLYMSGRLPPESTFTPQGDPLPNVVIVDDVNGWPGRLPKKLRDPTDT